MNAWSNIEISTQDSEIVEINKIEASLGKISKNIQKIRELITRFEVCHFKYQQHLEHIKASILNLNPKVRSDQIGASHISKGIEAIGNDKTGKSILGQQYVNSFRKWLGNNYQENSIYYNNELYHRIKKWLGEKNPEKERLIRLLIARLIWDWDEYEEYQQKGKYEELAFQACRMDICHYAFPEHLNLLIQGIGKLEQVTKFEGCGSFNSNIKTYIEKQYLILCNSLKQDFNNKKIERNEKIKFWLTACLTKTLKEQISLKKSLPQLTGLQK